MKLSFLSLFLLLGLPAVSLVASASTPKFEGIAVPYFEHGAFLGIRLSDVRGDSSWAKHGLKKGDIILSVNLDSVSSVEDLRSKIQIMRTEKHVRLLLKDKGDMTREIEYDN